MPRVGRHRISVAMDAEGEVPLLALLGLEVEGRSLATGRSEALSCIDIPGS